MAPSAHHLASFRGFLFSATGGGINRSVVSRSILLLTGTVLLSVHENHWPDLRAVTL